MGAALSFLWTGSEDRSGGTGLCDDTNKSGSDSLDNTVGQGSRIEEDISGPYLYKSCFLHPSSG